MPERFVGELSGDGFSQYALGPAPATPAIIGAIGDTAFQHRPIGFQSLPDGFEAELIRAAEGGQVRASEGSVGHVEVFRVGGLGTSIIGRPRPHPASDAPTPFYTLDCEEPLTPA